MNKIFIVMFLKFVELSYFTAIFMLSVAVLVT